MKTISEFVLLLDHGHDFPGSDSYTINLEANPSTGCNWERRDVCCPSIIDDSHEYIQHDGPPGTGGVDVWKFTALNRGSEMVRLVYVSSNGDIEHDFEFRITVV